MLYCVDCRVDEELENNFLTLNLWGKPVFLYVIEELFKVKQCRPVYIVTNSEEIRKLCSKLCYEIKIVDIIPTEYPIFLLSGRAVFLTSTTIETVINYYEKGSLYSTRKRNTIDFLNFKENISFLQGCEMETVNAFLITDGRNSIKRVFNLSAKESLVINTREDFELALVLKKKENNLVLLKNNILERIKEKEKIFQNEGIENGICLIGHSQIDNWDISNINSYRVRNCGICGISSFEYTEYILKSKLLSCVENIYIIMHGTNDIVYDYTFEQIFASINNTIEYIRNIKPDSKIYFLKCLHVNGRLDRSNKYIDCLNDYLKLNLKTINWIETSDLDDEFGNLKAEYTIDGLHLSKKGYEVLKNVIEKEVVV